MALPAHAHPTAPALAAASEARARWGTIGSTQYQKKGRRQLQASLLLSRAAERQRRGFTWVEMYQKNYPGLPSRRSLYN
jgi:hypothetical protein